MKGNIIRIARMDLAILGIDEGGTRLVYSIPHILSILEDEQGIGAEEAEQFFREHILNVNEPIGYDKPVFAYQYVAADEEFVDRIFTGEEIREAYAGAVDLMLDGQAKTYIPTMALLSEEEKKDLYNTLYQCHKDLHMNFLKRVKAEVTEITESGATGMDVMLDLLNLLKRLE